jgi:hypothetical protein
MAIVNLGRVGYVHKGAFNPETIYEKYDVVLYNHGSYLYIGESASSGKEPTNSAYWQVMLDPSEMNSVVESAAGAIDDLTSRVDSLTTPFSEQGGVVACHPLSNYSFDVCCVAKPEQSGGPFDAIRPLVPRNSVTVCHTRKNLCPSGDLTVQDEWVTFELNPPLRSNCTYTISATTSVDSAFDLEAPIQLSKTGSNQIYQLSFTLGQRISHTIMPTIDFTHIAFRYALDENRNKIAVEWSDIQIEVGSEATEYEPYEEVKKVTAEFNPPVYGGCVDLKNNVVSDAYRYREMRESDSWYINDNPNNFDTSYYVLHLHESRRIAIDNDAFMSHFRPHPTLSWNDDNGVYNVFRFYNHNGLTRLAIRPDLTLYPTVESFEAYLEQQKNAGTPVQLAYRTIEPKSVDITFTNKPTFTSIPGINTVRSDCGETIVNGRLDPAYQDVVQDERISAVEEAVVNGGGGYTLPIATAETLGGVKVGDGLAVDANGRVSATLSTLSNMRQISQITIEEDISSLIVDLGKKCKVCRFVYHFPDVIQSGYTYTLVSSTGHSDDFFNMCGTIIGNTKIMEYIRITSDYRPIVLFAKSPAEGNERVGTIDFCFPYQEWVRDDSEGIQYIKFTTYECVFPAGTIITVMGA